MGGNTFIPKLCIILGHSQAKSPKWVKTPRTRSNARSHLQVCSHPPGTWRPGDEVSGGSELISQVIFNGPILWISHVFGTEHGSLIKKCMFWHGAAPTNLLFENYF